jgi:hypothetical protein
MRATLLLLALALSGCASAQTPAPPPDAFVKLEEGGCGYIAACPAYAITLRPDGSFSYVGYRHVPVIGERTGQLAPNAWADAEKAFAASGWATLQDPTSRQGGFPCMPDSPFARITRHISEGDAKVFSYNRGCDSDAGAALLDALKGVMPIPTAP